jgi:hypothetical protein
MLNGLNIAVVNVTADKTGGCTVRVKMSCSHFYGGRIIKAPIWGKQSSGVFCIPFIAKNRHFPFFLLFL